jgi:hypothetical protein
VFILPSRLAGALIAPNPASDFSKLEIQGKPEAQALLA